MDFSEIKNHLSGFTVGIAGAGGLGSNCAAALARSGIGNLVICDFDALELSNLNRQYYFRDQIGMPKVAALKENIARIDPAVKVITHSEKLTPGNIPHIFRDCDVVVEAFDRAEMKEMLVETMQAARKGTPVIAASGVAGWGKNEDIHSRKIDETLYVCGDESSEVTPDTPAMGPRVAIVAAMQANLVIEILMNKGKHT